MGSQKSTPFPELVEGPFFLRLADGALASAALRQAQGRNVFGVDGVDT